MNVVTYLRVSSEQQASRDLSIPAQREALQSYADDKGWNIVHEYVDEAKSAKAADNRADFQLMIATAQKSVKEFNTILVHKFDRFSRSREDHIIYKALLKKQGILVISASEPTEPDTPHGMLLEGMLEVISEFYNMNLKFETLKGMKENATQGFHCGGRAPYGYRRVRNGSKVNYCLGPEYEIAIVIMMFKMASEGSGGKKIARYFNDNRADINKLWKPSTVLSILSNQAYLGYRTWNKKSEVNGHKNPESEWIVTKERHPAIIDLKLWEAAQAELLSRRVTKL